MRVINLSVDSSGRPHGQLEGVGALGVRPDAEPISLARWGHYGVPVLVFPTAGGDAEEIERHQLLAHLTPFIEEGRIKVYSCDSVAGRAMTAADESVEYRCWLFNQFQRRSPTRWCRRSTRTQPARRR